MRILVVGGGLAAAALVASLRRRGSHAAITVLCAEDTLPYDRPPLSKELFTRTQPLWLHDEFALADDAATWVLGTAAAELVPGGVRDRAGRLWEAEHVVLATGVAPRTPWPGARTLHTWDDAAGLRAALEAARSVAIVGAGWLGLELATVARERGLDVTLIDAAPGPLGTVLPGAITKRIAGWIASAGVAFLGGSPVADLAEHRVRTSAGAGVTADHVAVALGSTPATSWLPRELLTPTGHVRADGDGRVRPGVWAIGDCAESAGAAHPHWNDAVAAAERCAAALAGDDPPPRRAPHGFSTMFGHDVQTLGVPSPEQAVEFVETATGWTARLSRDDELRAVVAVDSPRDVAKARTALARL